MTVDINFDQRDLIGPIVFSRGSTDVGHKVDVLCFVREDLNAPDCIADGKELSPVEIDKLFGWRVLVWSAVLSKENSFYIFNSIRYNVEPLNNNLQLAFVSCNGMEHGDFDRAASERNALWQRLAEQHSQKPISLLIHGGDQIYADCVIEALPELENWLDMKPEEVMNLTINHEMEDRFTKSFMHLWFRQLANKSMQRLLAEVPSLMMWDDHDIFDGWGSRKPAFQTSDMGKMVFRVARRMACIFQFGRKVDDRTNQSHMATYPGFSVLLPDLRSEREPLQVMSEDGWQLLEKAVIENDNAQLFLVSTVPVLGPRLSLVEKVFQYLPGWQKYEDDLRDQWQSHAHRDEWKRLLQLLVDAIRSKGKNITVLSGEIHLAAHGEMQIGEGEKPLHQFIASGISHDPPPKIYSNALSVLSFLGEHPLPGHPISMRKMPGQKRRYINERNYLLLHRENDVWHTTWELEDSGTTDKLFI